jgi:hypothetical protein
MPHAALRCALARQLAPAHVEVRLGTCVRIHPDNRSNPPQLQPDIRHPQHPHFLQQLAA